MTDEQRKILDAFGFGLLQDAVNMLTSLEKRGVPEGDVREVIMEYVQDKKNEHQEVASDQQKDLAEQQKDYASKAPQCPSCHAPLMIRPINAEKGIKNTKGYKSEWYCIAEDCVYERYSTDDITTELSKHKIVGAEPVPKQVTKTPAQNAAEAKRKPCQGCG